MFELCHVEIPGEQEWLDGTVLRLSIGEDDVELRARELSSGKSISRGCYRWKNG